LLVTMDNDFGIGLRAELESVPLQFALQLGEIVNLPIEHHPYRLFRIRHWLMATRKVNDGKAAKTKPQWTVKEEAFVIRSAVHDRIGHSPDCCLFDGCITSEIELTCDSANLRR